MGMYRNIPVGVFRIIAHVNKDGTINHSVPNPDNVSISDEMSVHLSPNNCDKLTTTDPLLVIELTNKLVYSN